MNSFFLNIKFSLNILTTQVSNYQKDSTLHEVHEKYRCDTCLLIENNIPQSKTLIISIKYKNIRNV